MHRWFDAGIARYGGLSKTHAQQIMESIAYNLISDTRDYYVQLFQIKIREIRPRKGYFCAKLGLLGISCLKSLLFYCHRDED